MKKIRIVLHEARLKISKSPKLSKAAGAEQFAALRKLVTDKDIKLIPGFAEILHMGYVPLMRPNLDMRGASGDGGEESGYAPKMISLLGYGAFGSVYEVVDKTGKRFAAKVAQASHSQNKQEFLVRTRIEELRKSLPPAIAKHFVRLHEVKKLQLTKHGEYFIFIMDFGRKMNPTEEQILYKGFGTIKQNLVFSKYRLYPNSFVADFNNILKSDSTLESGNTYIKKEKVALVKSNIMKIVQKNKEKLAEMNFGDSGMTSPTFIAFSAAGKIYADLIASDLWSGPFELKSDMLKPGVELGSALNKLQRLITNLITEFISEKIEQFSSGDFKFGGIGGEWRTYAYTHKNFDEEAERAFNKSAAPKAVKSFINALLYLKKNHNISWNDLAERNVMISPKTGDYIAVDVGLFEI